MGRKVNIVPIPSTEVSVEGYVGKQYSVETGNKRTVFVVFKSDDVSVAEFARIKKHLESVMALDDDTKLVLFAISSDDDLEIHELGG